jgi:hypothetical protein
MTIDEALIACKMGEKIQHKYFYDHEYFHFSKNLFLDESNNQVWDQNFNDYKLNPLFFNNWNIKIN